jgi:hypothetical protein
MATMEQMQPGVNYGMLDAEYKTMQDTENKFANGPESGMVRSNANVMQHLGLLDQARENLKNGNTPALNVISNFLGKGMGHDAQTAYDLINQFVSDELSKSLIPGGGTGGERYEKKGAFDRDLGDRQISTNIKTAFKLIDAQQRDLTKQYQRGTYGAGGQYTQFYPPEATAVRDRLLGPQGGQGPPPQQPPAAAAPGTTGPATPTFKPPAGTVRVPLKTGKALWLTPDNAQQLRQQHPEWLAQP